MTLTIIFGLGRYFCLKQMNAAPAGELDSHIHTQAHTQSPRTPGYKKLTRTTLNSTECFSKLLIMVLKHVSLCIDPGKAKAAMGTKRREKEQWIANLVFSNSRSPVDLRSGRTYKLLPILFERNLPSQLLYMPGLTHHSYTPKPSGARVLDQCQSIYIFF